MRSTLRGERARYAGRKATAVGDMRRLENARCDRASLAERLEQREPQPGARRLAHASRVSCSRANDSRSRAAEATPRDERTSTFAVAVAFLLYMSMILYGQEVLRGVLEEKSTRVAEVVVSSVSPETLLAGKVIGVGAVGLTQQIIWVVGTLYLGSFVAPIARRAWPHRRAASGCGLPRRSPAMSMPDVQHREPAADSACSSSSATASTRRCTPRWARR